MKSIWKSTLLRFAMGSLLAVCCNTGVASAQNGTVTGNFTLPYETHWQRLMLPAGEYTFSLNRGPDRLIRILHEGKAVGYVVTRVVEYVLESRPMSLTIARSEAGNTVRDLDLSTMGQVLHFPASKPPRGSASAERASIQLVPITITGK